MCPCWFRYHMKVRKCPQRATLLPLALLFSIGFQFVTIFRKSTEGASIRNVPLHASHPFSVLFYLANVFTIDHNRCLVNREICTQLLRSSACTSQRTQYVSVTKTIYGEISRCAVCHLKCILLMSKFRQNRNLSTI